MTLGYIAPVSKTVYIPINVRFSEKLREEFKRESIGEFIGGSGDGWLKQKYGLSYSVDRYMIDKHYGYVIADDKKFSKFVLKYM